MPRPAEPGKPAQSVLGETEHASATLRSLRLAGLAILAAGLSLRRGHDGHQSILLTTMSLRLEPNSEKMNPPRVNSGMAGSMGEALSR